MLMEMDLLNFVTTSNLLPSSAKPLRALGIHPLGVEVAQS